MKYGLLSLALLAVAMPAKAGDKNKPVDLTGTWLEASRMSPRKEKLDYTDTTFYEFMVGNEYTTQRKNSFMYRGTYKATTGILDLGMRVYNILEMSPARMLLKDDAGTYEFVRYDKAARMVENSSAASSGSRAYKEDLGGGPVSVAQLAGKWEVYKRTSSVTMPEIDYTRIIRAIEIKPAGNQVEGSVSSAKDMDGMPSWKITRYDGSMLYCSGKSDRQLKVVRCNAGELIVQEDNLTYFFKQFK